MLPACAENINKFLSAGHKNRKGKTMKKKHGVFFGFAVVLIAAVFTLAGCDNGGGGDTATDAFLQKLSGSYEELFPVLTSEKYDDYWVEKVTSFAGRENAASYTEVLKTVCTATVYGAEAVAAYPNPESARFNCYFINGIDRLKFDGNVISGTSDGKKVFSHTYTYQGGDSLSGMTDVRVYKTGDENAGEFTYFLLCPDTPDTTYHIEFRYGSDLDELLKVMDGSYAYWLAAGIPINSGEDFVKSCIALFVGENLGPAE
jgi:hypothetical protein